MQSRQSIDFGSFVYWRSRSANSATRDTDGAIRQSTLSPCGVNKQKYRKHHHRYVPADLPPTERACIIIKNVLEEQYDQLIQGSSSSDEQLSEFNSARHYMNVFMEKFADSQGDANDQVNNQETKVDDAGAPFPPPNEMDGKLRDTQEQLSCLLKSYEAEIAGWQAASGKVSDRNVKHESANNAESDESVETIDTGIADVGDVNSDVREAAITFSVHADAVLRKYQRLISETGSTLNKIRTLAGGISVNQNGHV